MKPAGLVTLNQAKANLRLPALVFCLSCPRASPEDWGASCKLGGVGVIHGCET